MSCVFCAIVAEEAPAIRIYEDADYLAILDIRPFTHGHTLVLPKRHTIDLTDTPPETLADMVVIGQRIAKAARATELADATHIAINDGRARAAAAQR
jgi:histidine triad (HIT) family protein